MFENCLQPLFFVYHVYIYMRQGNRAYNKTASMTTSWSIDQLHNCKYHELYTVFIYELQLEEMQWFNGWSDALKRPFSWAEAMPHGSAHTCTHKNYCIGPCRPLNVRTQKGLRHRLIKTKWPCLNYRYWQRLNHLGQNWVFQFPM